MAHHAAPTEPPFDPRSFEFTSSLPPGALDPVIPGYTPSAPPPPPSRPSGEVGFGHGPQETLGDHFHQYSHGRHDSGSLNGRQNQSAPAAAAPPPPARPTGPPARRPLPTPPGAPSTPAKPASYQPQPPQPLHPAPPPPPNPYARSRALPTPPTAPSASYSSPERPLPSAPAAAAAVGVNSSPRDSASGRALDRTSSASSYSTYGTTAASSYLGHSSHTSNTSYSSVSTRKPDLDDAYDAYGHRGGTEQEAHGLQSIYEARQPPAATTPKATNVPLAHDPRQYNESSNGSAAGTVNKQSSLQPQADSPAARLAPSRASWEGSDRGTPEPSDGYYSREQEGHASSSQFLSAQAPVHHEGHGHEQSPSWAAESSRPWVQTKLLLHQSGAAGGYYYDDDLYDDYGASSFGEDEEAEEEMNEIRFFNPAYLSELAVQVRDRVIRGHHVKGGITWVGTFTGRDLIATIQSLLPSYTRDGSSDHRFALWTARSLHSQLWVVEVDWDPQPIQDSPDVVFKFMSEMEGMSDVALPKGVLTMATKCYAPSCTGDDKCYAPRCPNKTQASAFLTTIEDEPTTSRQPTDTMVTSETDWTERVDPVLLSSLTDQQRERQTLIRTAILHEEKYEADLAALETVFINPLLTASPPILQPYSKLERYKRVLFGNVVEIRRASRRLLDNFGIRLREQSPLVQNIGDIFLEATTDFRALYPTYTDNLPQADELLNEALEDTAFATWLDKVSRSGDHRWDMRYLLKRPATYLQFYPETIASILKVTPGDHPDYDFLHEALSSIQNISYISQLKLYHAAKGKGPNSTLKWYDIVSAEDKESMPKREIKRQMQIWELIQGEMAYVQDLEAIDTLFISPLRNSDRLIIPRARLETFVDDVFHNYRSILDVHRSLLSELQARQIEQHPKFGMVSDLLLNAALNWHEAYLEYMPNYPLSKAKIDAEKAKNPAFAHFLEECLRNPIADRQDINHYTYRPIARLLRYPLLLREILASQIAVGPADHPDCEAIPQIIDLIDGVAKAGQKGVAVNTAKVELWHMKTTLHGGKFGPRAVKELDLLNSMRELIHKGKVYRQPEGTISGAWSELHLLLFDNYFVLVKQTKVSSRHKDVPVQYSINRRPVPLELLSLGDFSQPAQNRSLGLLKTIRGAGGREHEGEETQSESRTVYPFTYSFIGQGSGQYTLWTDSAAARHEWQEKLRHAMVLRKEVNAAGSVFEFETLSTETFYVAPYGVNTQQNDEYTGRVTCSVPFVTADGRSLVAVGCEQGVWIGVRKDPSSLRKVLHVRSVAQIAVLEEFGMFLVLADKSLLAYHIEALVPTAQSTQIRTAPERLSGARDIAFFAVGQISGRTLVIYVRHKGTESVFRVLEPIQRRDRGEPQRRGFGMILGQQRTDWFREYVNPFYIPTEAQNVHFLNTKLAIVCARGFEIMDLTDLKGGAIPQFTSDAIKSNPRIAELKSRHDTTRPLAMFRSTSEEFLLCYATFGMYVNRYGEASRDMLPIEWEGTPDSVVFHPPYILLVSPSFTEVRHIDTAKLLQIYTGSDMRCTWDGTGARRIGIPGPNGWGEEVSDTSPRLHICKRPDRPGRRKGTGQHLYELVPTLLLNNPLLNPAQTNDPNYFPPAPETMLGTATMMNLRPDAPLSNGYSLNGSQTASTHHLIPHDRRSVSSMSTATIPNSPYPSSPSVTTNTFSGSSMPSNRRVSDQAYASSTVSSGFSNAGGFTAVDDYADYGGHRSQNQYYDTAPRPQRVSSAQQPPSQYPQDRYSQHSQHSQQLSQGYGHPAQGAHSNSPARAQQPYASNAHPSSGHLPPAAGRASLSQTHLPPSASHASMSQAHLPPRTDSYSNGPHPPQPQHHPRNSDSGEYTRERYPQHLQQQYQPPSGYQGYGAR